MNYGNQLEHDLLDRFVIKDFLLGLADASASTTRAPRSRKDHLDLLMRTSTTGLEKKWLQFLEDNGLHLPTKSQTLWEKFHTRPDYVYEGDCVAAIYIDGPHHNSPERKMIDKRQQTALENAGIVVIRFPEKENWESIVAEHDYLFGNPNQAKGPKK